jgi:hypothetical protein
MFSDRYFDHFEKCKQKYLQSGKVENVCGKVRISAQGLFISDKIMADFMVVDSC